MGGSKYSKHTAVTICLVFVDYVVYSWEVSLSIFQGVPKKYPNSIVVSILVVFHIFHSVAAQPQDWWTLHRQPACKNFGCVGQGMRIPLCWQRASL